MIVVNTISELRKLLAAKRATGIGFIPTMGALHDGHASLLRESVKENKTTVLSIFINPMQFGVNEDLSKYPRTLESDLEIAKRENVDIVFYPSVEEMYPKNFSTSIEVGEITSPLCGAFRPGHFRGVATVVARLFGIVHPNKSYFGQKDLQQCLVIQRMVNDLAIPVEIKICPTLREKDGLAMSSRNRYLNVGDREKAAKIYQSMNAVKKLFHGGEKNTAFLEKVGRDFLANDFNVQYFEIRNYPALEHDELADENSVVVVAAYLGGTRLIDNMSLS